MNASTKAKTALLKSNAPTIRSPRQPPPEPPRDYSEFDTFVKLADGLLESCRQIERLVEQMNAATKPERLIDNAEWWLAREDDHMRRVKQFHEYRDYYSRDELYDYDDGWVLKHRVVSDQAAVLVGSFPNTNPHSPECYPVMLIEEIRARKPNACVLESACRRIRRTAKFAPAISEVLEAIEQENIHWGDRWLIGDVIGEGCCVAYWFEELKEAFAKAKASAANPEGDAE
jgi:hypothetical protein